jgi:hypothetical protein
MKLSCKYRGCDFVTPSLKKDRATSSLRMHTARKHKGMQGGGTKTKTTTKRRARFAVNGKKTRKRKTPVNDAATVENLLATKKLAEQIGSLEGLEACLAVLKQLR